MFFLLKSFGPFGLAVGSAIGYLVRSIFYIQRFRLISQNTQTVLPSRETYVELGKSCFFSALFELNSLDFEDAIDRKLIRIWQGIITSILFYNFEECRLF